MPAGRSSLGRLFFVLLTELSCMQVIQGDPILAGNGIVRDPLRRTEFMRGRAHVDELYPTAVIHSDVLLVGSQRRVPQK